MATSQTVHAVFTTSTGFVNYATVERGTSASGPWSVIGSMRIAGGTSIQPAKDEGYFYDNTAPFGVPVWYRVTRPDFTINSGTFLAETVIVGPLTLVGSGTVVLSDPTRPWADIEFDFCATPQQLIPLACTPTGPEFIWTRFGERLRAMDAGLFNVLDAERPADIWARRKDHTGSVSFLTKSLDAIDRVYELFTAGGPLFLRAPAEYGRTDFYLQPGDVPESYLGDQIDQRLPYRLWTVPYTTVDGPAGPQQGTDCANWCAIRDTFPTFAALTATGDTWRDVADGTTVCP